jgi:hypothetical protein
MYFDYPRILERIKKEIRPGAESKYILIGGYEKRKSNRLLLHIVIIPNNHDKTMNKGLKKY